MNEIAPTSNRIESDPLKKTIVNMIRAMRSDYGQVFIKQFQSEEALTDFKQRLYQKLNGLPIDAIVDGYELCAERNTRFCPTVPGIVECVMETVKRNKKLAANKAETESVAALPPPAIICDPLALLAKAKAASRTGNKEDKAAWMTRKAEALKNHEAVLTLYGQNIKHRYAQPEHLCIANGCHDAGTLSSGTKGGGNWFCKKHFKTAG